MHSRFQWNEEQCRHPFDGANGSAARLVEHLLHVRGFRDDSSRFAFLNPGIETLSDPLNLPDCAEAIARIRGAIQRSVPIAIFGDYDADGVTSTAVLARALQSIGADVRTYLPQRERDGYGLNMNAVETAADDGAGLLVVVDCGTHNAPELQHAQSLGLETVVIDHHYTPHNSLPNTPFVSPRRSDSEYPFPELAAVGLCYQVGRAVTNDDLLDLLPIVALGTVADVVPLRGENRAIVAKGLQQMALQPPLGIWALAAEARIDPADLTSTDLAFMLGPRVNAAGRMSIPDPALELFMTDDTVRAARIANWLDRANAKRQYDTRRAIAEAEEQIAALGYEDAGVLVVSSPDVRIGIAGLVASRLCEQFHRPAIVFSEQGETSTGSARSIDGFNVVEALGEAAPLLIKYGGHSHAAGMTLRTGDLDALRDQLNAVFLREVGDTVPLPTLTLDAEITLDAVSFETFESFSQMEPFGQGNPMPVFLSRGVRIENPRTSRDGKHLMFNAVSNGGVPVRAIGFNQGDRVGQLGGGTVADLAYSFRKDQWNGRTRLNAQITDFRVDRSRMLF